MAFTLGIDVAVRAAHVATFTEDGVTRWRGRAFFSRPGDIDRLWADLALTDPSELTVVLEPTRNAWIVVAEWFRRYGARVVMVPTTQSSDLRKYYSKHTKNDRIDSELLARLPLLHPEGLREYSGHGTADPLRRLVKQRSTMVKRRTAVYARLDALVELLGPAWYDALGSNYGIAALEFLARYADPHAVIRLGQARLARFLIARSRGAWRDAHAAAVVAAARETLALWGPDGMDFAELAEDIGHEAEQALSSITKAGDPLLREMLCTAADQARKIDPQLAAKYQRLMAGDRHHDSAICHLATLLITRIGTCMRTGQPYQLRDVDGTPITETQGRAIVKERYQIDHRHADNIRHARMHTRRKQAASRESQESQSAPTSQPATNHPTSRQAA